ncbi:competence type IV pilus minor pilin ComGG [Peribacillus sp. SCS-37]|uniref:competence type IV pilus minor pilin ComGG n=1 Tax=Paraperibacillus esterisolvens TaxID=3115296 RepID=UPI00390619F2
MGNGRRTLMSEKGNVLPVVVVFSFLVWMALTAAISLFATEKQFYYEAEEKLKADYILKLGSRDLIEALNQEGGTAGNGFLFYMHGDLYYEWNQKEIIEIHMYASTKSDRKAEAIFKYDPINQKMIEWTEI